MSDMTVFRAIVLSIAALFGGAVSAGTISGSVTYLERMAVPQGAVLEVALVDVSRMDVPAETLSVMRYALDRVPFAFSLPYDDALIDERMSYNVQARILAEGRVVFRSTQAGLSGSDPRRVRQG